MSSFYVGIPLTGSFRARMPIADVKGYTLERYRDKLYLVSGRSRIELIPLDEEAYEVIRNFSEDTGDDCKSIYRLNLLNNTVAVILYIYESIKVLSGSANRMVIHLRADDEDRMVSPDGLAGITVEQYDDIPNKLSELFQMNRSVFFQAGKRGGQYTMLGDDCWATLIMEKAGVYVIDSFHNRKREKVQFGVHQIFGDIAFMLRKDALSVKGNVSATLPQYSYGEIFEAWEQYMNYQEKKLHILRANHIYGYRQISINGSEVSVELEKPVDVRTLKGIEFEYLPKVQLNQASGEIPDESTVDQWSKDRSLVKRFLGTVRNEDTETQILRFSIPRQGLLDMAGGGLIYLSGRSLEIEQSRRRKTLAFIESGKNRTLNCILRLSDPAIVDIEAGGLKDSVNSGVLKQMFGTDQIELTSNYHEAMDVAFNTPDIALIQGPPGTGKTTLIKGLLARLKQENENVRVMLSSEQHDAMYNMIDRFSDTGIMPPYVSSTRYGEDESASNTFEKSVERYQAACLRECERILENSNRKDRVSELVKKLTALLVKIRFNDYAVETIKECLPEMNELISKIGCADKVKEDYIKLMNAVGQQNSHEGAASDPARKLLLRKLHAQRLDLKVFLEDDGVLNFESLQSLLRRQKHSDELFPAEASQKLTSGDEAAVSSVFEKYRIYVEQLLNKYEPRAPSAFETNDLKTNVENIRKTVATYVDRNDYTLEGIVEKFQYLLEDEEIVSVLVRNYTTIVGSTCAQAGKLQANSSAELFDYVVIDEAARANPLDIMIPLALGKKVLMVGDHKQLPHYIETQDVKDMSKDGSNREILTKSLFQIIYENLERAKEDGRIKAKRTVMIEEQHRMHPVICKFISDTFYGGKLGSSKKTETHLNTYGICDGKNIGFINVPFTEGAEEPIDSTYRRTPEANKIIDLVSELLSKNPDSKFTIGIIAYYRGQVELLDKMIKDTFMEEECERISCGTVDSYQGKEFDIVILSGVRCNPRHEIGFIKSEPSRINVSLSRARNLMLMVCDVDTYSGASDNRFDTFTRYFDYCREAGYHE